MRYTDLAWQIADTLEENKTQPAVVAVCELFKAKFAKEISQSRQFVVTSHVED